MTEFRYITIRRLDELVDQALERAARCLRAGDVETAWELLTSAAALRGYQQQRETEMLDQLERDLDGGAR